MPDTACMEASSRNSTAFGPVAATVGDGVRHRLEALEEQQRRRALGIEGHRVQHDVGDEAERALGAHEQVREDGQRIVEVDEGVDPIAGHALDRELLLDQRHEVSVGARLVAQRRQALGEVGALAGEALGSRPRPPCPRPTRPRGRNGPSPSCGRR